MCVGGGLGGQLHPNNLDKHFKKWGILKILIHGGEGEFNFSFNLIQLELLIFGFHLSHALSKVEDP